MQISGSGPKYSQGRTSGTKCAELTPKKDCWKHCKYDPNTRLKPQLPSDVDLYAMYVDFSINK